MSESKLDHLVMVAADLNAGREYIEELLGVKTERGGKHTAMGTHNRLLRLGEDQYLEIIAIDPDGKTPDHPRWFALDDPELQVRIRNAPILAAWVARTPAIDRAAKRPPYNETEVRDVSRDDLRWRMAFTPDGGLPLDGALPLLIEWQTDPIPSTRLPDAGCALERLVVQSPQAARVQQVLQDLGLDGVQTDHSVQTGLAASLITPGRGEVVLSSVLAGETDNDL